MSFLAWIDFDQADRERTHRIMDLFREEDARDELGIGSVRDALADLMFPGTSTIQTRLRYMLFVPWIYARAAQHRGSAAARIEAARRHEIALIDALGRGGENTGVIGSQAREALKRLPSDVYWAALGRLGIRRFAGSRAACLELRAEGSGPDPRVWSPGLPEAEDGFLERSGFRLRREEADFLLDRLTAEAPESLLRTLAQDGPPPDCPQIWAHPGRIGWSAETRTIVDHAERFSELAHGAALLYNLLLSEKVVETTPGTVAEEREARYRERLADWSREIGALPLAEWDLDDLWIHCTDIGYRVTPQTMRFVETWRERVLNASGAVADDALSREIVDQRERWLKGAKSRLRNQAALDRWGGASGTERLGYRWSVVASHLRDLADAP